MDTNTEQHIVVTTCTITLRSNACPDLVKAHEGSAAFFETRECSQNTILTMSTSDLGSLQETDKEKET